MKVPVFIFLKHMQYQHIFSLYACFGDNFDSVPCREVRESEYAVIIEELHSCYSVLDPPQFCLR